MLVVSSREFRDNQKKYLDLVEEDEQVFIKRGKTTFVISSVESEVSYNPDLIKRVKESRKNFKAGKVKFIKDTHNVWESINIE